MSNNAKQSKFQSNNKGLTSAPTISVPVLASTARAYPDDSPDNESFPRCFYIKGSGNFVFKDATGVTDTYPVLASQQLIFENVTAILATTNVAFSEQY